MTVETHRFADDGETPNHPSLPVILMHATPGADAADPAAWFEETFRRHGWGATWRWRVYPYHHFHSTNHEVLGVSQGDALLMIGGSHGGEFRLRTGDVIIMPAVVGQKTLEASGDIEVGGAYAVGKKTDLIRSGEGVPMDDVRRQVAAVPVPRQDPVSGMEGPLVEHWHP